MNEALEVWNKSDPSPIVEAERKSLSLFAGSPSASIDAPILLCRSVDKMDELGITEREVDKEWNAFCPLLHLDGIVSGFGPDL